MRDVLQNANCNIARPKESHGDRFLNLRPIIIHKVDYTCSCVISVCASIFFSHLVSYYVQSLFGNSL